MSSDILYDKQFIKAKYVFFPIILCGSSNCFECGSRNRNGRRERSWWNHTYVCGESHLPFATRDQIMARLQQLRDDEKEQSDKYYADLLAKGETSEQAAWAKYDDNRFGYHTALRIGSGGTTFNQYKSFYKTGMDKALTVEQLVAERVNIVISTNSYTPWNKTESDEAKKAKELGIELLENVYPKTTEELLMQVDRFMTHYQNTGIGWTVNYSHDGRWFEKRIRDIRAKFFPKGKNEYEYVEVDHYFTVECAVGYFVKRTRRGYQYTYYPYVKFATESETNAVVKRIKDSVSGAKVKRVDETAKVKMIKKTA
jgi:hypothetical protein